MSLFNLSGYICNFFIVYVMLVLCFLKVKGWDLCFILIFNCGFCEKEFLSIVFFLSEEES